jgi:hypothetical protein
MTSHDDDDEKYQEECLLQLHWRSLFEFKQVPPS